MTAEKGWLARHYRTLLFVSLLAAIEVSYVFIVTAGRFTVWPTWHTNYDLLAEGFRSGHLYLSVSPPPALVAKANPFDPIWRPLWFWDASLHDGHYYLYWGPLPAIAIAVIKTVFRIRGTVGDQFPLLAFYTIYLVSGALLIVRMSQRLFNRVEEDELRSSESVAGGVGPSQGPTVNHHPSWLTGLCIAVFAYANPTPYLLATPDIYEAAIAGGQAFLVLGLLVAFESLWKDDAGARGRLLVTAGLAWGFAFACRASAILPAAIFVALTALAVAPPRPWPRAWRHPVRPALLLAAPIAGLVVLHLAYNKLRFDAWFDFGLGKQLSTMQFRTAPAYLLPNLYSYLARPLHPSCRFPFLSAPAGLEARAFPAGFTLPRGYRAPEPVAGLINATPWVWLAALAAVLVGVTLWRARRAPELPSQGPTFDARRARAGLWCGVAFLVLGTVTGLAELTEFFASMRFLADVAGGLVLAGAWAAYWLYARVRDRPWPGRIATAVFIALGGASIAIGLLLGVQGYDQMFQRHNPELFARWVRGLSRC